MIIWNNMDWHWNLGLNILDIVVSAPSAIHFSYHQHMDLDKNWRMYPIQSNQNKMSHFWKSFTLEKSNNLQEVQA